MRVGVLVVMMMVCLSDEKVTGCAVGRIITVSKLSNTSIPCPPVKANTSMFHYLLLFNDRRIDEIQLTQSDSSETVFSGHFEVTTHNSGVYKCKSEELYPPPPAGGCLSTEVIVAEKLMSNDSLLLPADQSSQVGSLSVLDVVLWVGCGVLLVYSLSITCVAIVLWRRLKRDDEDTRVYINTRPKELRNPQKNF